MPQHTFPNQRIIRVHRERVASDFLGIKNENWQSASRILGAHALRLYLYLASNADNFELALSPAAIEAAIGMPRSTYHDQFRKLINHGYLVETSNNHYSFYETPQKKDNLSTSKENEINFEDNPPHNSFETTGAQQKAVEKIEINNINTINTNNEQEKQVSPAVDSKFIF